MLNHQDRQEQELNAVAVTDDELREILSRLAIETEAQLDGRSTLRDIAELTEVPVNSIARILAEMRGEDELASLTKRVSDQQSDLQNHEVRISSLETKVSRLVGNGHQTRAPNKPSALLRRELNRIQITIAEREILFERLAIPASGTLPDNCTLLDVSVETGNSVGSLGRVLAEIRNDPNLAATSEQVIAFQRSLANEAQTPKPLTQMEFAKLYELKKQEEELEKEAYRRAEGKIALVIFVFVVIIALASKYKSPTSRPSDSFPISSPNWETTNR